MLERFKKAYGALRGEKPKKILLLNKKKFPYEEGKRIKEMLGDDYIIIGVDDVNADARVLEEENQTLGDGQAAFLGEGTPQEFEQQKKEDQGFPRGMFGT